MRTYIMNKTHIQHPVCFIQYKNLNIPQRDESLVHQVKQPTGSGYQNIHSVLEGCGLLKLVYSAKDYGLF